MRTSRSATKKSRRISRKDDEEPSNPTDGKPALREELTVVLKVGAPRVGGRLREKVGERGVVEEGDKEEVPHSEGEGAEGDEDGARQAQTHHGREEDELVEVNHRPKELRGELTVVRRWLQESLSDQERHEVGGGERVCGEGDGLDGVERLGRDVFVGREEERGSSDEGRSEEGGVGGDEERGGVIEGENDRLSKGSYLKA